jgi:signal transduction histidine kinase
VTPGGTLSLPAKMTLLALAVMVVVGGGVVAIVGRIDGGRLVALAAVLAIPAIVVYVITRFLVARLTVPVVGAYQRLAAGDFSAELPTMTAGKDFLGLRVGFRAMADALERTLTEIKQADQERRRLFADLAHELATPTTTLIGIAAGLRTGDAERERMLDHLERESARLARLIADVRELAVLEDPALPLLLEPCDVSALAKLAADRIRLAHPEIVDVRCELPATALTATLDPIRIDQVLTNLLTNAARYAGTGAILVRVSESGGDILVRVEDGGPGVPDDELPQLGRRLHRIDRSRSRDSGGHGLGLSIVRAIAIRHGGSVRFERASLGGLAAEVRLPIAPA